MPHQSSYNLNYVSFSYRFEANGGSGSKWQSPCLNRWRKRQMPENGKMFPACLRKISVPISFEDHIPCAFPSALEADFWRFQLQISFPVGKQKISPGGGGGQEWSKPKHRCTLVLLLHCISAFICLGKQALRRFTDTRQSRTQPTKVPWYRKQDSDFWETKGEI